jgi:hypothetical protein
VSNTDLVKSGWYFTELVAVVLGMATFAGAGAASFFPADFAGTASNGLVAVFASSCEGAATDGFFTGSAAFSLFGTGFFDGGGTAFFTGVAFSGVFLLVFATGFSLAAAFTGAAGLEVCFFAAGMAAFLTAGPDAFFAGDAFNEAFGACLAPFAPLATAFFGAAFFVAMMTTPFLKQ